MRKLLIALLIAPAFAQPIETISNVTTTGSMTTTVRSPPPSAISPQIGSAATSDLCTVGVAGAVQTQILGISAGTVFTEENCIRLKNAKTLYDMGMRVAAVSVMCQDKDVFNAMMDAGTPCPYDGKIGEEAKLAWKTDPKINSEKKKSGSGKITNTESSLGFIGGLLGLLLIL